jgi:F-type H+-transporting ATPase subunit b
MHRILLTLVVSFSLAFLAPAAFAADTHAADAGHEAAAGAHAEPNPVAFDLVPLVATLVMFGVVFFVLNAKVWPVITKALNEREAKITKEIGDAESARKQAAAALNQYERALAEARTEAAHMLESTKAEQQKMAAEIKRKAETEITAMKDAATRDIESAKRAAISEVYAQMSTTATSIASKIIQRELNPADQARFVEESLAELSGVARSN